jgi:trk system potassium uptake protein
MNQTNFHMRKIKPKQMLVGGFTGIILFGALFLALPVSSRSGEAIPFLDALFTAASATCVTGLVVADTWTRFSMFGQLIIMLLIQIGGLGFMTIAILFSMVLGKRIGLRDRSFLMESVSALQLGGIVKLARRILIGTFLLEVIGAIILAYRFVPLFGWSQGIWFGIFHSVSAFCNAGFDLMGKVAPYASLTPFVGDILVNGTVMMLIVLGGIGFVIWDDMMENHWNLRKCTLHTRITVVCTGGLILFSTLIILLLEWNAGLAGLTAGEKILAGLFQSVTPRTAGFNTIDTAGLSEGGTLFTILLMVIGAGPGSTGGGIKITTFAVISLSVWAHLQGNPDTTAFKRRLDNRQIQRAFTSAALYFGLALIGSLVITGAQNVSAKTALFEAFSAIGTVGLSLGLTGELVPLSRWIIILLMVAGRLGSITVFLAMAERDDVPSIRRPEEKVVV